MMITYDHNKNLRNIEERGLSFDLVAEFDFEYARFELDERRDYREPRTRAFRKIHNRFQSAQGQPPGSEAL
jgi:uncharacterized DUF497 family protein